MRSHQNDVTALEQWKPLINKIAFKAAQRADAIDFPMTHADFVQELSITVLKCQDNFNPEMGVKMITFLYTAMYNEVNKIFNREENSRRLSQRVEEYKDKDGTTQKRVVNNIGYNMSGDSTYDDDGQPQGVWDHVPDEGDSPEEVLMEQELSDFIHANVDAETSAALCLLESQDPFVMNQMTAYNTGVQDEANAGGIRRMMMNLDFSFICKLMGFNSAKTARMSMQIKQAITAYGT